MRTTLTLDDDVFELVVRHARLRGRSLGKTVSDLVRRGLSAPTPARTRNGLVVFHLPADSPPVTTAEVRPDRGRGRMKGHLLDTNVLIALFWPRHQQHERATRWFARHRAQGWATCPLTEAGFVRIVSNPAFSRDAVQPREAIQVLAANTAARDHTFWPDELPVGDAVAFSGVRLIGHQQVTDAYLLGLALRRGGRLATLDQSLVALTESGSAERKALELVA